MSSTQKEETKSKPVLSTFHIRSSHYLILAIGFACMLAYRELVQDVFEVMFPTMSHTLSVFLQAMLFTLILIVAIAVLPNTESVI